MKLIKHKQFRFVLLLVILVSIPLTVYLAQTIQNLNREAAVGEVTLNITPTVKSVNPNEAFTVDIYASSGTKQISGISVKLTGAENGPVIVGTPQAGEKFTDVLYDPNLDPFRSTVLSRKPTADLPVGNFKVASFSMKSAIPGSYVVEIHATDSQAVGFNGNNADVAVTVIKGTSLAYTITGSLCRIAQCIAPSSIQLAEISRIDNKKQVNLTWTDSSTTTTYNQIYRNVGSVVPTPHVSANLVGTVTGTSSFSDTNNGKGYDAGQKVYYDIDSYVLCTN